MARLLALGMALFLGQIFACGGPSERHCAAEAPWSGTCTLKSVLKIRQVEFPTPHGIYEVIYEPQANPSNPNFTPPALREEIKVLSSQELELDAYFKQNQSASCQMSAPQQGSCQPGKVSINLPPFQPTGATPAQEVHGCAQLESQATQDKLPELSKKAQQMPEVIQFGEASSEASPEATQAVNAVAQRMKASPGIECVAIVGQISPGESISVANDRARTVRQLLIQGGVDPGRLTTIPVTEALYGGGTEAPPKDPTKRRVTLRILLAK
jgi:outer membrane protein OmpA-like peptidoglycan-associated protein